MRFSDETLDGKLANLEESQEKLQREYRESGDGEKFSARLLRLDREIEIIKGFIASNLDKSK